MSSPDVSTLIVVVLYRADTAATPAELSPVTLRCLTKLCAEQPQLLAGCRVLLWDNSPLPLPASIPGCPCAYRHAASEGLPNDGVSGAYNAALAECMNEGIPWLLLLDQDTELTAEYLAGMSRYRDVVTTDDRIAAIAPLLFEKELQLSPQRVLRYRFCPAAPEPARVLENTSFAANSGVLMRTAALQAIGGYSVDFWLDHSDIELFHRLYQAGKRIYLAADVRLQHSMTMLDYDGRMSAERYGNFLAAEQAFFDLYRDRRQNAVQLLRLAVRTVRQRRYRNPVFSRMTWAFLLRRMTSSRATRLRQWQQRRPARLSAAAGS